MMKQILAAAALIALAGCGKPASQNVAVEANDTAANMTDITEVPDESADANAAAADDNALVADNTAVAPTDR